MMFVNKTWVSSVYVLTRGEGLNMGVNPTQNLQMFPIAKISTSAGKSPYATALQCHKGEEFSKDPSKSLARPAERPACLEKGSVVNIYI
jgi:hypothetical protein